MLGTLGKDNLQIGEGEIILIQIFAHQRKGPIHALFIQHRGVGIGLAAVLNGFANAAIADKGKRQLFSQRAGWQYNQAQSRAQRADKQAFFHSFSSFVRIRAHYSFFQRSLSMHGM